MQKVQKMSQKDLTRKSKLEIGTVVGDQEIVLELSTMLRKDRLTQQRYNCRVRAIQESPLNY